MTAIPEVPGQEPESARVGPTYQVGAVGAQTFYRTSIATRTAAYTCRAPQVSQAAYDSASNRTYFAYSAGDGGTDAAGHMFTAQNPTIMAFDHGSQTWEGPVEIFDLGKLPIPAPNDCHDYPQVVVDARGILHVFYTCHFSNINIQQFSSARPHDITAWTRREIEGTATNTYGAAFKNAQGHIYVFYRATLYKQGGEADHWYEPEMYVKSKDEGEHWSAPKLLIDPGRPTIASAEAIAATDLINNSGWNTIYVSDWHQDHGRNRLWFDFTSTEGHIVRWGNSIVAHLDMDDDTVCSAKPTTYGPVLTREHYTKDLDLRLYEGVFERAYMDANEHGLSQAIVVEEQTNGHPTVYYGVFESDQTDATWRDPEYYQNGHVRLKRGRWDGERWVTSYVGGSRDPGADPFIQWDGTWRKAAHAGRRPSISILDAEYRGQQGTFLYLKTRWGGHKFWLDPGGRRRPDYAWGADPARDYQYPLRIFNTRWGVYTNVRWFGDHPDWEVRGVSNFTLIPGGHPAIRAILHVPKYTALMPSTGTQSKTHQYAIGAEYICGEQSLQADRSDSETDVLDRAEG